LRSWQGKSLIPSDFMVCELEKGGGSENLLLKRFRRAPGVAVSGAGHSDRVPRSCGNVSIIYKTTGHHPSCFENLSGALQPFGVDPDRIPTTFNMFMNVSIAASGELTIGPPRSRPGDYIHGARRNGPHRRVTACSAQMSDNYRFKPNAFEIDGVAT
jgi:hypothetical protein